MWKAETRHTYDRKGLRYPTDVTDAEWGLARPFVAVAPRGGRVPGCGVGAPVLGRVRG